MRRALGPMLAFALTALLYAWGNRLAEAHFRVSPDLALLYPATGIGVAAVFFLGWPAAAGIAAATIFTPWSDKFPAEILFAGINVLESSLVALVFAWLARRGSFRRRERELRTPKARLTFFLSGVAANTGLCSLLGNGIARGFGSPGTGSFLRDVVYWWVGDATAALMIGWPLVELTIAARRALRGRRARRHHAALVAAAKTPGSISVPARNGVLGVLACWIVLSAAIALSRAAPVAGAAFFGVPILAAAYLFGFRGGLVVGSLLGWISIGQAIVRTGLDPTVVVATSIDVFDRVALGIITGGLFEANRRMIRRMRTRYASLRGDLAYVAAVLTSAVESKDPYTEGHMQRVSLYAVRIARRLGLSEDQIEDVRLACLLHDIGKIGVPDHILFKPEPLFDEELKLMRSHVEIGARIASNCSILRDAVPVIRNHQERFDGRTEGKWSGYPDGLKGDQIHLYARICAVADAYDTMTTNRPYRKALGREKALAILVEERGAQFDPVVVDAFLADLEERRHKKATTLFSIAALMPGAAKKERSVSSGSHEMPRVARLADRE